MSKINWNLDQLKFELSKRKNVKSWMITEENIERRERYFMSDQGHFAIDQDRSIHSRNISLRIFVHLSNPDRQGEMTKKLFTSMPLKPQIDVAIEAALQTDHQAWELPNQLPSEIPNYLTTDPKMGEDLDRVMVELTQRIEASVKKKRKTEFNSSELFLSVHHSDLHLSNGLSHRTSQSRIYTESAFSFSQLGADKKIHSDEFLTTQWAVHLDHLALEKLFDSTANHAEKSLDVIKPETGKYSVIVDSEVLSTLMHGHLSQLRSSNAYNGLPFIKPGSDFISNAKGDLLSITLDPTLPFGADTTAISDYGNLQSPLKLVDKNRVLASSTDKQHGDYLKISPTTTRGNLVIDPGALSYQELTQYSPIVIEIIQFSGLFADANSGTFSSEIRLARIYDNKKKTVSYLKGGSLSGSIQENFQNLKLSNEMVNRAHFSSESHHGQGYYGPNHALLSDVSIVG